MPTSPPNLPFEPATGSSPVTSPPVVPPPAPPKATPPSNPPPATAPPPPPRPPAPPAPAIQTMPQPKPAVGKSEPEDIFAKVDGPAKPAARIAQVPMSVPSGSGSILKYVFISLGGLIVLGVIGYAIWSFLIKKPEAAKISEPVPPPMTQPEATPPPPESPPIPGTVSPPISPVEPIAPTTTPATSTDTIVIPPPITTPPPGTNIPPPTPVATGSAAVVPVESPADTDNDGLADQREKELGTDSTKADSDADGVLDGEEVLKYGTNPLNVDTDGDSYLDGNEIKNGYSPRGPGKCANTGCVL